MHSNWNPWHGCVKKSEGCENCYVYYIDSKNGRSGRDIYKTKGGFTYPLFKDRSRRYKIQSGETISVCMTSDFFLEEADAWRPEAWEMMRIRSDVIFLLITKRPERIRSTLPEGWGEGWENIFLHVTCENQKRADERIPLLLDLPFRHKGLWFAPLLGPIQAGAFLDSGQIEQAACGGENYGGQRPCDYAWVKSLSDECRARNITFCFMETGTVFLRDGKEYHIPNKKMQNTQALKSGLSFQGRKPQFDLRDSTGHPIPEENRHVPKFVRKCGTCSFQLLCNGCSGCGLCRE